MATSDLTIVILNYNSQFWLKKTLESLKQFYLSRTQLNVRVVVVDNASQDQSVALIRRSFRWVELIVLPKNVGFAAGNNVALTQSHSEFTMLLNSDMELTAESNLDHIVAYLREHSKVAVVTPKVLLSDGRLDPACHRGEPTPWASASYFLGLARLFPHSRWFGKYHLSYLSLSHIHFIDACSGAAMVVRTHAMRKVGLLDEQFFMYAEDLDWCHRFRNAGYQVVFYPEVSITHHKHKSGLLSSSIQTAKRTRGHFYDTMLQYYDKYYRAEYPAWVRGVLKYFISIRKGDI